MERDDAVTRDGNAGGATAGSDGDAPSMIATNANVPETMATIAATSTGAAASYGRGGGTDGGETLPNTLTIIGRGVPSSVDVTVDGAIEPVDDGRTVPGAPSGTSVECTVEADTRQYRFSGDLTDVTFVDRAITGSTPAGQPNVHVEYEAPDRPSWVFDWQ